jgi:hypothetical protein
MTEENLPVIRASRRVELDAAQPARMRSMLCRVGSAEDYAQQATTLAGQGARGPSRGTMATSIVTPTPVIQTARIATMWIPGFPV